MLFNLQQCIMFWIINAFAAFFGRRKGCFGRDKVKKELGQVQKRLLGEKDGLQEFFFAHIWDSHIFFSMTPTLTLGGR